MKKYRRVNADIDLDAVLFNFDQMNKNIPEDTKIMAVVKTDAYGHGAVPIASFIESREYLWGFATATVDEAVELRKAGIEKPILILGYTFPYCYERIIEDEVRPAVYMYDTAKLLSEKAVSMGRSCKIHLKIDTGMTRIGMTADAEGLALIRQICELPGLEIEGIFTHFATADETDKRKTLQQLQKFA